MAGYAFHKNSWENYEKMQFEGYGEYDIPEILPTDFMPEELIKFNYRGKSIDKAKAALHFLCMITCLCRSGTSPKDILKILRNMAQ